MRHRGEQNGKGLSAALGAASRLQMGQGGGDCFEGGGGFSIGGHSSTAPSLFPPSSSTLPPLPLFPSLQPTEDDLIRLGLKKRSTNPSLFSRHPAGPLDVTAPSVLKMALLQTGRGDDSSQGKAFERISLSGVSLRFRAGYYYDERFLF